MQRFQSHVAYACLCVLAVTMAASDPPQQVHIAYAGRDESGYSTSISVSWVTEKETATSTVRYGTSPSQLKELAKGSCSTYLETYDHVVVLSSLQPETQYYYVVGDADAGYSKTFKFTSAPRNHAQKNVSVILFGDMGVYNSNQTRDLLRREAPAADFIWHVGDISYADDAYLHHPLSFYFEKTWNEFMQWQEDVAANVPYMTCPGNHEAECHSPACSVDSHLRTSLSNFTAYNHRFRMPSAESGGVMNMWYSFNYGPIHFVNIDTETDFPGAPTDDHVSKNGGFGDQMAWLEADLAKAASPAERALRPWILVGGHRPVYSAALYDPATGRPSGPAVALQAAVEGLFSKYGVDVYFCGHQHSYERSYPVFDTTHIEKSYDHPTAPVYIVAGAAGNTEGHTGYPDANPAWTAVVNNKDYGIGHLAVQGDVLSWKFMRGSDGQVLDSVEIRRRQT